MNNHSAAGLIQPRDALLDMLDRISGKWDVARLAGMWCPLAWAMKWDHFTFAHTTRWDKLATMHPWSYRFIHSGAGCRRHGRCEYQYVVRPCRNAVQAPLGPAPGPLLSKEKAKRRWV